eukprot:GFYU01005828.1.p1 GENE.GFYU01005828.1~~GFYU01005828.1.p1  ORF type:complete len:450 (-),score=165.66 GFYU01005828.1:212-1561(-)
MTMSKKRITQETFDEVVRENMEDFDMPRAEAVADAVEQFSAQGVDLGNINTSAEEPGSAPAAGEAAAAAAPVVDVDTQKLVKDVEDALEDPVKLEAALKELTAQMKEHIQVRDRLGAGGVDVLKQALEKYSAGDAHATKCILSCIKQAAIKQENNRQVFVDGGVMKIVVSTFEQYHDKNGDVVKEAAGCLRAFTLRDDERAPFSKGHEHTIAIAKEKVIPLVLKSLVAMENDVTVLAELLQTVSRLAVNDGNVKEVLEAGAGGIPMITRMYANNIDNATFCKAGAGVLRSLAGNDKSKHEITANSGVQLLLTTVQEHMSNAQVVEKCLGALGALTLRNESTCNLIVEECQACQLFADAMTTHSTDANVHRQCSILLRNLVSRTPQHRPTILETGVESSLRRAMTTWWPCVDVAKAALRDLHCDVHLEESFKSMPKNYKGPEVLDEEVEA